MLRKISLFFFIISILVFCPPRNWASDEAGEELRLYLGQSRNVPVTNLARVVIGNPAIADVINITQDEFTIEPKSAGMTTLTYVDSFGENSYKIRVLSEDLSDIKRRIDNLLAQLKFDDIYTKAEDEEGKVFLLGMVRDIKDKDRINAALGALKDKTRDLIEVKEEESVVEIDVQVLELNKGATDTLGFTWPGALNLIEKSSPGLAAAGAKWGTLFRLLDYQRGTSAGADPFTFKLDMLVQEGKARILSRPRLACQSGKEAKLLVGGEVPTFTATVSQTSTTGEVNYKEYGIILKVKPVVDEARKIHLGLNVEVSELGTVEVTTYARAYPLTKRNASTELFMEDGQTLAIGGLIKQKTEEDLRKFPWLADVPVLGLFFRQRTTKSGGGSSARGDTELFITLTPRIIAGKKPAKLAKANLALNAKRNEMFPAITENFSLSISGYADIVQKRILDNLIYPKSAKDAGFQGTVRLGLRLSYRGQLLESKIIASSGYNVLDDIALATAKGIGTYPPFPSTIEQDELWIEVPIVYRMD